MSNSHHIMFLQFYRRSIQTIPCPMYAPAYSLDVYAPEPPAVVVYSPLPSYFIITTSIRNLIDIHDNYIQQHDHNHSYIPNQHHNVDIYLVHHFHQLQMP
eukprot:531331_1